LITRSTVAKSPCPALSLTARSTSTPPLLGPPLLARAVAEAAEADGGASGWREHCSKVNELPAVHGVSGKTPWPWLGRSETLGHVHGISFGEGTRLAAPTCGGSDAKWLPPESQKSRGEKRAVPAGRRSSKPRAGTVPSMQETE
jgi:hypothetical protein